MDYFHVPGSDGAPTDTSTHTCLVAAAARTLHRQQQPSGPAGMDRWLLVAQCGGGQPSAHVGAPNNTTGPLACAEKKKGGLPFFPASLPTPAINFGLGAPWAHRGPTTFWLGPSS